MWYICILLTLLVLIEFLNMVIRLIKIIPDETPPLTDEIRIKMYS